MSTKKKNYWHKLGEVRALRHLVQFGFFAFIFYVAIRHTIIGEDSGITVVSAEAYCPFGGLEGLYKFISSGGSYLQHTHLSNLVVLAAALLTAFLAKSAFCGWICPFGTLQDWLHRLGKPLRQASWLTGARRLVKKHPQFMRGLDHWLSFAKYLVLIWIMTGTIVYGVMVFRDYDPYAALLSIAELESISGLVILLLTALASLFMERPWCRYACPLGAVIGLTGKLSPVKVVRKVELCKNCRLCDAKCPMGLAPSQVTVMSSASCNGCLECVAVCPKDGALEPTLLLPGLVLPQASQPSRAG
ncbi:MAG: 4Fe-4S binding protein [Firmicutes bacterium]|nr:4Fe-4S binding protein [Bacillota bacterium]MCL5039919.1 4Fe-4S binding protein [Bacillota bacterium]